MGQARIDQTREWVCDEIAAESLFSRAQYARSLLSIAQFMERISVQPLDMHWGYPTQTDWRIAQMPNMNGLLSPPQAIHSRVFYWRRA
jgi:beta-lactamase regulating signal transducer with metallopeptidase domain